MISLKKFIEQFQPIKQTSEREYKRFIIINDNKASTYNLMAKVYSSNVFTGTKEDKKLILYPGRKYSMKDSFFIFTANPWESEDLPIEIDLTKK